MTLICLVPQQEPMWLSHSISTRELEAAQVFTGILEQPREEGSREVNMGPESSYHDSNSGALRAAWNELRKSFPSTSDCRKRRHHTDQLSSIPGLHISCTGFLGSAAVLTAAGPVSCPAEALGDQDAFPCSRNAQREVKGTAWASVPSTDTRACGCTRALQSLHHPIRAGRSLAGAQPPSGGGYVDVW